MNFTRKKMDFVRYIKDIFCIWDRANPYAMRDICIYVPQLS